jgi:tetratricopeptide (TPR) repeat protein
VFEARFITAEYERRINGNIIKQDQIMDKLIEDYPEHWQLRVNSGYIKNQLLDAKGSEKRWEEALELNPGSYEALTSLVFLHIESGASTMLPANDRDLEKAKAYLETVRTLNPNSSRPDRYMGNIYRKENDLDKALASYQKANNMIEDKESQLYRNGLLMQGHVYTFKGEYDEGREKYYEGRSGAMKNQDYQWSMAFTNYIAQGYLYQKDFASAISVLSEMQQTVENFEETELQKINRKSFLEFFKFIAFGHSQKPEETLASISKIKELNEQASQIRLSSSDLACLFI